MSSGNVIQNFGTAPERYICMYNQVSSPDKLWDCICLKRADSIFKLLKQWHNCSAMLASDLQDWAIFHNSMGSNVAGMGDIWREKCLRFSDWIILAGCFGGKGSRRGMFGRFLSIFLCHFFCLHAYRLGPSNACTGRAARAFGVANTVRDELNDLCEEVHRCLCLLTEISLAVTAASGPWHDAGLAAST